MKQLFYLLLILVTTLTISSCSTKKEEKKAEDLVKRKWTIQSDSHKGYLTLKVDDNKNKVFYTDIISLPDTAGEWSVLGDTVLMLTGDPIFDVEQVDSTVMVGDSGKAVILYFSGGREIGKLEGGELRPKRSAISFEIKKISEENMSLISSNNNAYSFEYKPKLIQNNFSILSILRGLLGIAVLLGIAYLFSANRKRIDWMLVGKGISIQIVLAICLLKIPMFAAGFEVISQKFIDLIEYTQAGTEFLFKTFGEKKVDSAYINFAFYVLPTIIFFSALTSLFYYWGVLQIIVKFFAKIMQKILGLSGSESMAAAGNVFLGQTEAPLLIKPYLLGMTKSEFMTLMTGGMATIAGGVLAGYIGFLGNGDPAQELFYAKHLLIASIMSAPAAIVAAKILVPETEEFEKDLNVPKDKIGTNALEAITNGTTDGIKLAVNVAGMLLVFIALVAFGNGLLGWVGEWTGINDLIASSGSEYKTLSFDFLLGYICAPLVWLMGVPSGDMVLVGELLGKKTVINEFVGYIRLGDMKNQGLLSEKAIIMSTYMLCGFANIASIGIQIGGIGALVPSKKGVLSKLGVRALLGGTIACLLTAVVVGMMM